MLVSYPGEAFLKMSSASGGAQGYGSLLGRKHPTWFTTNRRPVTGEQLVQEAEFWQGVCTRS